MLADLYNSAGVAPFYPLVDELRALRRKQIPNGIKFSYAAECAERNFESDDEPCMRYDRRNFVMKFWRGLQSADVARYQERVMAYNRLLRETTGNVYNNFDVEKVVPPELKLAQHVAGDAWPEDFVITIGDARNVDGCGNAADGPDVGGWVFGYWPRKVLIDVVLIENTSSRPITVGDLLGTTVSAPSLRVATSPTVPPTKARAVEMAEALAPGERLLVATRVAFVPNGLFRRLDSGRSVAGRTTFSPAPAQTDSVARDQVSVSTFRNYAYGPEINVTGFLVNSTGVDLNQRPSANFGDLAVTRETGSCPFLMSWDAERQEWIDHGKVLDKAPRPDLQYSEVKVFPGFQSRFRIEEREPEIASIDEAELTIVLRNGERRRLRADHAKLAALDGAHCGSISARRSRSSTGSPTTSRPKTYPIRAPADRLLRALCRPDGGRWPAESEDASARIRDNDGACGGAPRGGLPGGARIPAAAARSRAGRGRRLTLRSGRPRAQNAYTSPRSHPATWLTASGRYVTSTLVEIGIVSWRALTRPTEFSRRNVFDHRAALATAFIFSPRSLLSSFRFGCWLRGFRCLKGFRSRER